MYENLFDFYSNQGFVRSADILTRLTLLIIVVIASTGLDFLLRKVFYRAAIALSRKTKTKWDDAMVQSKLFRQISHLSYPMMLTIFSPIVFEGYQDLIDVLLIVSNVLLVFIGALVFKSFIDGMVLIYNTIRPNVPIKGIAQIFKLAMYLIAGVISISLIIQKSPIVLLGGIGATAAILTFLFKDAILGFISSIQIASNKLVRTGDWIEFPELNLEGTVEEITLTSIKARSFDMAQLTIPTYKLTSQPVKNWQSIFDKKGRRMKRVMYFDVKSVQFVDKSFLAQEKEKPYFTHVGDSKAITNLELFRAYLYQYLSTHPNTHSEYLKTVRLLSVTENGVPLQIISFCKQTSFLDFSRYASQVTEYVAASAPLFKLKVFQRI